MIGSANKDGPDLSLKGRVTEPRQGAVQVECRIRGLPSKLRTDWTLKYASGMTSTRWRTAAHSVTGRMHSRFAGNARLSAAASFGSPEQEPRLRSAAVNSAAARTGSVAWRPPSRSPWGAFLGGRAGGPNAAHPNTQIMSTPYLRLDAANGKGRLKRHSKHGLGLGLGWPIKGQLTTRS